MQRFADPASQALFLTVRAFGATQTPQLISVLVDELERQVIVIGIGIGIGCDVLVQCRAAFAFHVECHTHIANDLHTRTHTHIYTHLHVLTRRWRGSKRRREICQSCRRNQVVVVTKHSKFNKYTNL